MDVEQMKADLGPGAVFDVGEENTAFAQYFTGECYLKKMLTTEGVAIGNVSFAPKTQSIEVPAEGGGTQWCEPVNTEEYERLK